MKVMFTSLFVLFVFCLSGLFWLLSADESVEADEAVEQKKVEESDIAFDLAMKDPKNQSAIQGLRRALEIADSRDPNVRIAGWKEILNDDDEYHAGEYFNTSRFKFSYRWFFMGNDEQILSNTKFGLRVKPKYDITSDDKDLLHTIFIELKSEWAIGSKYIQNTDLNAGRKAIDSMIDAVISEAVKVETDPRRLKMLNGENRTLAMAAAYRNLVNASQTLHRYEIEGSWVTGDIFTFQAAAYFDVLGNCSVILWGS